MATDSPHVSLRELCDSERGITYGIVKVGEFVPDGVPVIRGGDIRDGRIVFDDHKRVTEEISNQFRRTILRGGEIVINLISEPGHTAIVPAHFAGFNVTRDVAVIPLNDAVNHRFVDYYLKSPQCVQWLTSRLQGSVTQKINLSTLNELPIPFIPLPRQQAIACILGSLDDKIECNRRMNRTLEAIARAVFRSWFVDFDPVRAKADGRTPAGMDAATAALFPDHFEDSDLGKIPAGWKALPLPEALEVNPLRYLSKGCTAPYLDMGNMPTDSARALDWSRREFGSGMRFRNGDTLVARITPCLENGKTAFVDFLADDQVGWGSTEYIVLRPLAPLPPEYAYYLARTADFRDHAIVNMTGTSGRQRVPAQAFHRYLIVVPPEPIAKSFGTLASSMMAIMKQRDLESRTLAALRDTLLPKLISGELRVPNAERLIGRAV